MRNIALRVELKANSSSKGPEKNQTPRCCETTYQPKSAINGFAVFHRMSCETCFSAYL